MHTIFLKYDLYSFDSTQSLPTTTVWRCTIDDRRTFGTETCRTLDLYPLCPMFSYLHQSIFYPSQHKSPVQLAALRCNLRVTTSLPTARQNRYKIFITNSNIPDHFSVHKSLFSLIESTFRQRLAWYFNMSQKNSQNRL